jgi:hypothetical protein
MAFMRCGFRGERRWRVLSCASLEEDFVQPFAPGLTILPFVRLGKQFSSFSQGFSPLGGDACSADACRTIPQQLESCGEISTPSEVELTQGAIAGSPVRC